MSVTIKDLTSLAKPLIETPETKSMDSVISMPTEHSESQQTAAKNDSPLFEDIHIQNYINIEKEDKSTIVISLSFDLSLIFLEWSGLFDQV